MNQKQTALELIARIAGSTPEKLEPHMELVADLGLDSAGALELLVELEGALGIEIGDDEVTRLNTVGDILAYIESA
ncbi:MAG: acyl carrier protein [Acidobacteriota bacterium]